MTSAKLPVTVLGEYHVMLIIIHALHVLIMRNDGQCNFQDIELLRKYDYYNIGVVSNLLFNVIN